MKHCLALVVLAILPVTAVADILSCDCFETAESSSSLVVNTDVGADCYFALGGGFASQGDPYWLLASLSGTSPGVPVGTALLPLNPDEVTLLVLENPNTLIEGSQGTLGTLGFQKAYLGVPAGAWGALKGYNMDFAFLRLAPSGMTASNPVSVTFN
jgi:hypothetical protein